MSKKILVAPLNWGLGHATRCIPIINALIDHGYEPIIASDGVALTLLQKEFPKLSSVALPPYHITYPKDGNHFKWKLIKDSPKLLRAIKAEKKATRGLVEAHRISGIISDNRLGVYSETVPSVFITHQLNVLSGNTTRLSTMLHQKFIRHFDVCWVPDLDGDINLSGVLGHAKPFDVPTKYIGPLSRFNKLECFLKNDLLVLLSGPEPQRTLLEEKLLEALKHYSGKVVLVKGLMDTKQSIQIMGNLTVYNFMTSQLLEKTINESALVLSRSGYTTIMDLAKLDKKAFFIPTPGQFEQEYLAKRLTEQGLVPSCSQAAFTLDKLKLADSFMGLCFDGFETDFKALFMNLF